MTMILTLWPWKTVARGSNLFPQYWKQVPAPAIPNSLHVLLLNLVLLSRDRTTISTITQFHKHHFKVPLYVSFLLSVNLTNDVFFSSFFSTVCCDIDTNKSKVICPAFISVIWPDHHFVTCGMWGIWCAKLERIRSIIFTALILWLPYL